MKMAEKYLERKSKLEGIKLLPLVILARCLQWQRVEKVLIYLFIHLL